MGAPYLRRAVPEFRKSSGIRVVLKYERADSTYFEEWRVSDITPAEVRRSDEMSVNAIDEARNTHTHASEGRASGSWSLVELKCPCPSSRETYWHRILFVRGSLT